MLERYGHGGDIRTAEEAFGLAKEQFVDFSANMNPLGPPEVIEEIIKTKWADVIRYPDPASRDLVHAIASYYDIPEASILIGNGAAELIDLLVREISPKVTGLARPSFTEYEDAVRHAEGKIYSIPLSEEHDFTLQSTEIEQAISRTDLIFLGHPNNPTGKLVPRPIIDQIMENHHPLILDEAFIDFLPDEWNVSQIRRAAAEPNLFVIRSMTKFYTIPGIRLGFMVAHPDLIGRLRERKVAWSVNFLAQAIGEAVLDPQDGRNIEYANRTQAWLSVERLWLTEQLEALRLRVTASEVNFLLFKIDEQMGLTIQQLQQQLGHKGVLVRDASLFNGLNNLYGRVAIRLRSDNERLVQALREILHDNRK
ncbi:threonine-phosphate decarboxylase CobD [Paenibacillus albiflavus]|uniref:threonine-phosphate decarboxylase CobD n=1 Tax=Paenibacillus albiflavus TaxID=2545760 RepID=UPI001404D493|nr:threonine-phosphate decarboxylase CobD [Paenibacillus albiflavus]